MIPEGFRCTPNFWGCTPMVFGITSQTTRLDLLSFLKRLSWQYVLHFCLRTDPHNFTCSNLVSSRNCGQDFQKKKETTRHVSASPASHESKRIRVNLKEIRSFTLIKFVRIQVFKIHLKFSIPKDSHGSVVPFGGPVSRPGPGCWPASASWHTLT